MAFGTWAVRRVVYYLAPSQGATTFVKDLEMGKGNNSQKNDKKNKKPKADAKKPANKGSNAK